jgi:serine O-acetyltransferase
MRSDIQVVFDRDPAARTTLEVVVCYPGLHAIWFHRVSHWLWVRRYRFLGRLVSHIGRFFTGIEIHPGATIGRGFFIDHGMGIVIGETAEVGENVTLYHGVTLGGVSWRKEKRHPTVGDHVVIGAGAKVLGPIFVGEHSRIGANSVVVKDVPAHAVVVGVPGRTRMRQGELAEDIRHEDLQHDRLHDTTMELVERLAQRLSIVEAELAHVDEQFVVHGQVEADGYDGPWGI